MTRTAIWVDAQDGDDDGDGTVSQPFRTFVRAMQVWRTSRHDVLPGTGPRIILRHGAYELDEDGMTLLRQGLVLAGEGLVRVNGTTLEVRPRRARAGAHA